MKLEGTQSLVTGASSGIGLATAAAVMKQGGRIVHGFDRQEPLKKVDGMQTHIVDVTDAASVARAMREVTGQIHVLFNNAGILRRGSWAEVSPTDVQQMFELNVRGSVHTLIAALQQEKLASNAVIVQMCSIVGEHPSSALAAYSLTKQMVHTLIQLQRALRPDLRFKGVYPHAVQSPMTTAGFATEEEYREQALAKWGCITQPEDVAGGIVELLKDDAAEDLVWNGERKTHVLRYK